MAGRRFDVTDVVEVLQHWQAGRTERRLARSFGMGRNRVAIAIRQSCQSMTVIASLTPLASFGT